MANIQVLDQITIDKIAAGEVIERPASIVKELVENAIDAGATAVTVEIKEGGISFIRITDNGCGIPREEVALAFLRHSTSKIRTVEDLTTVASLGFRGEALSSIAAIAQVELITKTKNALLGTWEYSWDSLVGRCVTSYQFKLDGTVIHDFSGAENTHSEGKYTIENDKIVCKWDDYSADYVFAYSLQGDSLYLEGATKGVAGEGEEYRKK